MGHFQSITLQADAQEWPRFSLAARAERLVLAAICVATLLFVFITPPFQAPDEDQHYMKALLLSEGRLLTEARGGHVGADLPRDAVDLRTREFPPEQRGIPYVATPEAVRHAWNTDDERRGEIFAEFPNLANYSPSLYLPSAAGIVAAKAVGLPRLGGLYLGRLFDALAALALLILALRLMPFGRLPLLAVAALPTFAEQTGSLSADASINSIGFLGLALSLRLGFEAQKRAPAWPMLAAAPFLGLAKGVYLPVLLAGLRWPFDRRALIILGGVAGALAAFLCWLLYSGSQPALYTLISRKTGEATTTAPLAAQLAVILGDPFFYVRVLTTSVIERTPVYILQIVGRFGWNTILLPLAAYPLAAVMITSALLGGGAPKVGVPTRAWWLLLAIGGAILVETALYLTGTPYAADYIQGTQGRYFIPFLPLGLLAIMPRIEAERARSVFAVSALILVAIGLMTAIDSFWLHGFTEVEGLPPIEASPEGILRALLLPSPRW